MSVAVPLRGETPVVEVEEQTLTINTVIGMEYSVDNGASWNAFQSTARQAGNIQIIGS